MEKFIAKNRNRYARLRQKHILTSLAALRTDDYVDVTLVCGDKEFGAHKLVLEASSPYFQKMFRSGLEEQSGKVVFKTIEPDILDAILNYIYSGDVSAINSEQCVKDVLAAAHMMQLHDLTQFCFDALSDLISKENWTDGWHISILYEHEELKTKVLEFALSNFETIKTTDVFLQIYGEKVTEILKFAGVKKLCFNEFLEGALEWLRHDLVQREAFTSELFACIEPALLRHTSLKSLLRNKTIMTLSPEITNKMNELATAAFVVSDGKQWEAITFTVSKLSELKDELRSPERMIQNVPWSIVIKPSIIGDKNAIGFYIACNHNPKEGSWACRADIKCSLLSKGTSLPDRDRSLEHVFCRGSSECGYQDFITLNNKSFRRLIFSNNQGIPDDTATFQADIIADAPFGTLDSKVSSAN